MKEDSCSSSALPPDSALPRSLCLWDEADPTCISCISTILALQLGLC